MIVVRTLACIALLGWLACASEKVSLAQSDEDTADKTTDPADVEEDDDDVDPVIVDGVFTPSEKIEADSEISFPADI